MRCTRARCAASRSSRSRRAGVLREERARQLRGLDALLARGTPRAPRAASGYSAGSSSHAPPSSADSARLHDLAEAGEVEIEERVVRRDVDGALHQRRAQHVLHAVAGRRARRDRARETCPCSPRTRRGRRFGAAAPTNSMILSSTAPGCRACASAGRPSRRRRGAPAPRPSPAALRDVVLQLLPAPCGCRPRT